MGDQFWVDVGRTLGVALRLAVPFWTRPIRNHYSMTTIKKSEVIYYDELQRKANCDCILPHR